MNKKENSKVCNDASRDVAVLVKNTTTNCEYPCKSTYKVEKLTGIPLWIVHLILDGKVCTKTLGEWEFQMAPPPNVKTSAPVPVGPVTAALACSKSEGSSQNVEQQHIFVNDTML